MAVANLFDELVGRTVEVAGFEDMTLQLNMSDGKIWLLTLELDEDNEAQLRIEVYDHEIQ